jgi:hypothetical protein
MQPQAGRTLELLDARQRRIGQLTVEGGEDDLLVGRFVPGPAFPAVERLFRDFEQAVNAQALRVVDQLDADIGALGLQLRPSEGGERLEIHDVQIWSDGGMSCRLGGVAADGPPESGKAARSVPK